MRYLPLPLLLLALLSCRTPVEVYQALESQAYQDYRTFAFADIQLDNQTELQPYQPNLELLESEISRQLQQRGLSPSDAPDLLVNIGIVVTREEATRETTIQEAPLYTGQRNYRWQSEEVVYDVYEQGALVVDLVDTRTNELVWKGAGARALPKNPEKRARLIRESVEDLFRKFPLPPGGP